MKTQIENEDFNFLQDVLNNFGWTCETIESECTDFWTTFETDCPEEEFDNIVENLKS